MITSFSSRSHSSIHVQDNAETYPTLACIALDVLAIPASSVPCERLFSAAKLIATDHHSSLGAECFEELQMMKYLWRDNVMRWFHFIRFIVFISLVIPCLQVTQVILSFSLLIFGLIGSYLIWRLYSILEEHLPSYWYLVLWTLL